jgi:hypothetical protein
MFRITTLSFCSLHHAPHVKLSDLQFARRSLSSLPLSVKPSSDELSTNTLSWRNLQIASRALHRDGLVVLENVLDTARLDNLNEKMVQDARFLQAGGDKSPFNYNKGYVYWFLVNWTQSDNC